MDENVYYVAYDADAARGCGVAVPEEGEDIDVFYRARLGKLEICEGPDFEECVDEIARAVVLGCLKEGVLHCGDALHANVGIITVDAYTHNVLFHSEETHAAHVETFVLITTDPDLGPLHGDYICEAEEPYGLLGRVGGYDLY